MEFLRPRTSGSILILLIIGGCAQRDPAAPQGGDPALNEEWKQCRACLESVGAKIGKGSARYDRWLKEKKVPDDLAQGLLNCCLQNPSDVGAIRMYSEAGVMSANTPEAFPIALKSGFLMLGTCPNGDPVVIDIAGTRGSVGYLCGETMWQAKDARTEYVAVAASLAAFVQGLSKNQLPIDYFEAKDAQKK